MQQATFGKLPAGQRLEKIKQSAQYKDGFVNISNTPALAEGASYSAIIWRAIKGKKNGTPSRPLPVVTTQFQPIGDAKPVITWFVIPHT